MTYGRTGEKMNHHTRYMGLLLILLYNAIMVAALCLSAPLFPLLVLRTEKRRLTFFQRMGWSRYQWQSTADSRKTRRIWVHALSLGEVLAAHPLVDRLRDLNPDVQLFFTASTLTGYQTARRLFEGQDINLAYFPYDCIWAVRKVVSTIDPTEVIITETDIWPNFMWEMKRRKVPVHLANLRFSDRTWKNYKRFKWVAKKVYAAFHRLCVQTEDEKHRLTQLDVPVERICVTGSLKFDGMKQTTHSNPVKIWSDRLNIPADQRFIVAGSTHEGEEVIICNALKSLLMDKSDLSLILAPRDPLRSKAVQALYRQNGLACYLLSSLENEMDVNFPQVVVVDYIGVLKELYSLAHLSFVGGSLVPFGGHNPLEPAFWGKPVIFGNDMRDFELIAEYLLSGGGALRVEDGDRLELIARQLLDEPEMAADMGKKAENVLLAHQGAVNRTLEFLKMDSYD